MHVASPLKKAVGDVARDEEVLEQGRQPKR